MPANLKELITFASAQAETIFRKTGALMPMYHAVTYSGANLIVPQPDPDKDRAVEMVKAYFHDQHVESYVFMSEAWLLDTTYEREPNIEAVAQAGLADHPDRREVIAFAAENIEGEMQIARRFILRPEIGKPKLMPLEFDNLINVTSSGRMVGLLKRKT